MKGVIKPNAHGYGQIFNGLNKQNIMDIQRELKNDLTSITGVIELQDGIYLPLKQVEEILIKRLEQVKKLTIPDVIVPNEGDVVRQMQATNRDKRNE